MSNKLLYQHAKILLYNLTKPNPEQNTECFKPSARSGILIAGRLFTPHPFIIASILILSTITVSATTSVTATAQQNVPRITHGIASGDVTNHSAVIWSRSDGDSMMNVKYDTNPNFTNPTLSNGSVLVSKTTGYTGQVKLDNLKPNSQYYYQVWLSDPNNKSALSETSPTGLFHTAPDTLHQKEAISFVVGGDLGGQNYCKRVDLGYPIFSVIKALSPDFFIFNGDQVYADGDCKAKGPDDATGWHNIPGNFSSVLDKNVNWSDANKVRETYEKHWDYNRADNHLQGLLSNTSLYSQADDHEVINNYGGNWSNWSNQTNDREGFKNLAKAGIETFFDYSPIDKKNKAYPEHIYRNFSWGKDMDLFILDAHTYRDRNDLPQISGIINSNNTNIKNPLGADTNTTTATDSSPTNTFNKTLLGKEQLQWLEHGLQRSNATWKIVSNDDPIFIPECRTFDQFSPLGCDNWATDGNTTLNFVNERNGFLKFLDDNRIDNVVFITTDVHFPANIVLSQDFNSDGNNLTLHELVSGPISAWGPARADPLDPTVNAKYLYNEVKIFNFGYYKVQKNTVDGKAHFISEIRGADGLTRPGSQLDLTPQ